MKKQAYVSPHIRCMDISVGSEDLCITSQDQLQMDFGLDESADDNDAGWAKGYDPMGTATDAAETADHLDDVWQ